MFDEKVRPKAEAYAKDKIPNSGWYAWWDLRDETKTTYMDGARYGYGLGYRAAMTNGCLVIKGSEKGFDLNGLCKTAHEYAKRRQENGGKVSTETQAMLKHCATEVVEATESYTRYEEDACDPLSTNSDEQNLEHFASELADIICCVLIIASEEGIDIEQAITDCIEKNRKRAEGMGDKK